MREGWRELGAFVSLGKEKYNPKSGNDHICIELGHIAKETGALIGTTISSKQASIKNRFQVNDLSTRQKN